MNVRKPTDYSAMFAALDELMAANLPQMELYRNVGRVVGGRPEKGAAVAAAEYLQGAYPDATGFSPRSLRRMRDFCRAYESAPGGHGQGHDHRLDAERGHHGGGSDAPGEGVVHSRRPAVRVVQVGVGKADLGLRSFGDNPRLARRNVLY